MLELACWEFCRLKRLGCCIIVGEYMAGADQIFSFGKGRGAGFSMSRGLIDVSSLLLVEGFHIVAFW